MITLNDDGFWCWFQDERAVIHNGYLTVGSTAAGSHDSSRYGDIDAVSMNLKTGEIHRTELANRYVIGTGVYDDHSAPAFMVRPDGTLLAVWTGHYTDTLVKTRATTDPSNPNSWGPTKTFDVGQPLSYSNPYYLSSEDRIYNFTRSNITPRATWSDDHGESWTNGNTLVGGDRPYIKFASNGTDEIHFLVNDGHPGWQDNNSTYHGYYKNGNLYGSDGTVISSLDSGLASASQATLVYQGNAQDRSWATDLALDPTGKPVAVFSVQHEEDGQVDFDTTEGFDHRYYYGRWDGSQWQVNQMAYAGTRLFGKDGSDPDSEADYTGLVAIDPDNVNTVYISTNVNPDTGIALSPNNQFHEIFKGVTVDDGLTWDWDAVTVDSGVDNIRPIVPKWDDQNTALLWARGTIVNSSNYDLDIVGIIYSVPEPSSLALLTIGGLFVACAFMRGRRD
jgi:hypothetical protein